MQEPEFNRLFEIQPPSGTVSTPPWRSYRPRARTGVDSATVAGVERDINGTWLLFRNLLGTAPGDEARPIRIVIWPEPFDVGYGQHFFGGLSTHSCDFRRSYMFVPMRHTSRIVQHTIAHELFHVFQSRRRPGGPIGLGSVASWWTEGTADMAANMATGTRRTDAFQSLLWSYGWGALDSLETWNPSGLPQNHNGIRVRELRPYIAGAKFAEFLASNFGVQPNDELRSPPRDLRSFGRFLASTFHSNLPPGLNDRAAAAEFDRVIDQELRTGAVPPQLQAGLGEVFGHFAAARMSGEYPTPLTVEPNPDIDPAPDGLFRSWLPTHIPTEDGEVVLNAENGMSVQLVSFAPPESNKRQVRIKVGGMLSESARLYIQSGHLQTLLGEPGYGNFPVMDISENARGPEVEGEVGSPLSGSIDGRTALWCMTGEPSYQYQQWPDTGELRVLLVNTAPSPSARPVRIRLHLDVLSEPCQVPPVITPGGGPRLKPDGTACPPVPEKPADAPDSWQPPPNECDAHEASYRQPPSEPPHLPQPFFDPWLKAARPLPTSEPMIIGSGGLDCEQNRRDRARARAAGRARTPSEQIVDRICDRLSRERH